MDGRKTGITRRQDRRVAVSSGAIEIRRQGKPVGTVAPASGHVYLVIDCSVSMAGAKLIEAKEGAVEFARDALAKGYGVGLIQFGSSATLLCEPQRDLGAVRRYVGRLRLGGSTDLASGISMAVDSLGSGPEQRSMVIVTDGQPNSRAAALKATGQAKMAGIDIIAIGTDDADEALLQELATRSDLSTMVAAADLGRGIASTARMLPGRDRS